MAVGRQVCGSGSSTAKEDFRLRGTDLQNVTVELEGFYSHVGT